MCWLLQACCRSFFLSLWFAVRGLGYRKSALLFYVGPQWRREREIKKKRLWKGPFVSSGKEIRLSVNISCILLLAKPYFSLPFDT